MLGAIAGDIIGSTYELIGAKNKNFNLYRKASRYTDDTVLTMATLDCLLENAGKLDNVAEYYGKYARKHRMRGYGGRFYAWANLKVKKPYNSYGNGSAMRVSPVAYVAKDLEDALRLAKESAEVTHNHEEGIKGAQATAGCIYLALNGHDKNEIKSYVENEVGYKILKLQEYKIKGKPDTTCQNSVPQSIASFLESTDYEDCIRNAISLGGDSDTTACIAGGIAEACYNVVPEEIKKFALNKLNKDFITSLEKFEDKYIYKLK